MSIKLKSHLHFAMALSLSAFDFPKTELCIGHRRNEDASDTYPIGTQEVISKLEGIIHYAPFPSFEEVWSALPKHIALNKIVYSLTIESETVSYVDWNEDVLVLGKSEITEEVIEASVTTKHILNASHPRKGDITLMLSSLWLTLKTAPNSFTPITNAQ